MIKNYKTISILGLSKMGLSAAQLAKSLGLSIFISEIKNISSDKQELELLRKLEIPFEVGGHTNRVLETDLIIKSPGVNPLHPLVVKAGEKGIPVTGEIDFAISHYKGNSKFICITGSNGKTTSTLLLCQILKLAGIPHVLSGHRNMPLSEIVYENMNPEYIVQEVSCSDLRDNHLIKPHYGAILNIYPDHLDLFEVLKNTLKSSILFLTILNRIPGYGLDYRQVVFHPLFQTSSVIRYFRLHMISSEGPYKQITSRELKKFYLPYIQFAGIWVLMRILFYRGSTSFLPRLTEEKYYPLKIQSQLSMMQKEPMYLP